MGGRGIKRYEGTEKSRREVEVKLVKESGNRTKGKRERRNAKRHGSHERDSNNENSPNGNVGGGKNKDGNERGVSFKFDNDLFFENRRREGELEGNTVYWELKKG